ncbi:MAG: hypothetical protein RMA76_22930 [Deltaproteobacteria bacterium]|jgi:hypothetical protein
MRRILLVAVLALFACKKKAESVGSLPYSDDFERAELGPDWYASGGQWMIENGYAYSTGANNAPCFLKVALPADVVVEVDVRSETRTVDSKIELMTDGRTHQSGYVFILGGWNNQISAIARLDEHGKDRVETSPTRVTGNQTYRWRIEKKGGDIRWYIDGKLYLTFNDPEPLSGPGHDRLALSNWQNRIRWDNLKIWAYADAPPVKTSTTGGAP